jgi:hypothetical protein
LSVDPLVAETGQPYAFTGDDPLNATDPLGLFCIFGHVSSKKNSGCRGSAEVKKAVKVVKKAAKATAKFVVKHKVGELEIGGAILTVGAAVVTGGSSLAVEGAVDAAVEGGAEVGAEEAASASSSLATGLNAASTVVNGIGCAAGQGDGRGVSCAAAVVGVGGIGLGLASSAAGASDGLVQLNNLYTAYTVAGLLPAWAIAINR